METVVYNIEIQSIHLEENNITIMENLKIREFSFSDNSDVLELLYELGRPKPQNVQEEEVFQQLINNYDKDPKKRIFVAETKNKIVGVVIVLVLLRLNQIDSEIYIPELIVSKNYQNQGIGKELINSCIDFAKEMNCYRIRLESGNQRLESHKFYRKLGFDQSSLSFSLKL